MPEGYLVIDTNIWVHRTQLLTIPIGAALLYAIHRTKVQLALPEIIERELSKHTLICFREAIESIHEGYRLVGTIMGVRDNYAVPSEHELLQRIESRLLELSNFIHRVPFTFAHAENALSRVMDETPPNGHKNQQFKDSAIWEALLELSAEKPVHFITQDGGFFKDIKKKQYALADNLEAEAKGRIKIYYEVSDYLDQIKEEVPELDRPAITAKIDQVVLATAKQYAEKAGYKVNGLAVSNLSLYLTEKHNVLAVDFQFSYRIENTAEVSSSHPQSVLLEVKASTSYLLKEEEVGSVSFRSITAKNDDQNNIGGIGATFVGTGFGVVGRGTVPYAFKEPIRFESDMLREKKSEF